MTEQMIAELTAEECASVAGGTSEPLDEPANRGGGTSTSGG